MNAREIISILYPGPKARLGELQIDAFVRESHSFANDITEHPIESGGTIVDHIHNKPLSLSLDGIISNTPMSLIGLTAFDSAKRFLEDFGQDPLKDSNNFVELAYKKIEDLFAKREPITIATSLKIYPNMVLENLTLERGGGVGDAVSVSCTAKQIQIVSQKLITAPKPKVERAKPKEKKGLQETKTVPEKEAAAIKEINKSSLASVRDGISDALEWAWKKFQ